MSDREASRQAFQYGYVGLLCATAWMLDILTFWPGHASFDTAYALWQALGGETSNIQSPMFTQALRVTQWMVEGPGGLFFIHASLFWLGMFLLLTAWRAPLWWLTASVALMGFAPLILLLRGHVWADVGLFSALMCATGLLANSMSTGKRPGLFLALPLLFYATALRHNALPAVIPFVLLWAVAFWSRTTPPMAWHRIVTTSVLILVAFAGMGRSINERVDHSVPVWPSLAQFDLVAISVETGRMWLPDFFHTEEVTVETLREAHRSWSNVSVLSNTGYHVRDPFFPPFSDEELRITRQAWWLGITLAPSAWLHHRWQVTKGLFGTQAPDWPETLVYVDRPVQYRDNSMIGYNEGLLHQRVMKGARALHATAWLAAWPYLLLGLLALPLLWKKRVRLPARFGLLLWGSAWCYALPLTLLAPSAELRYLGWPCVASLLALTCAGIACWLPGNRATSTNSQD